MDAPDVAETVRIKATPSPDDIRWSAAVDLIGEYVSGRRVSLREPGLMLQFGNSVLPNCSDAQSDLDEQTWRH
jgi:hypothetical protein